MTFAEKVRSLKGSQILLAMITGLKEPATEIDMLSYGHFDPQTLVCYGCAATNTIANLMGITVLVPAMLEEDDFSKWSNNLFQNKEDRLFLCNFEDAIDYLRRGHLFGYNAIAEKLEIATLPDPTFNLPPLTTNSYLDRLPIYEKYLDEVIQWENSKGI